MAKLHPCTLGYIYKKAHKHTSAVYILNCGNIRLFRFWNCAFIVIHTMSNQSFKHKPPVPFIV